MSKKKSLCKRQVVGFLGLGLDNDGEQRLTRCENFFLLGGSQGTHEHMQDTAIRFSEALRRTGKPLLATPLEEIIRLLRKSQ